VTDSCTEAVRRRNRRAAGAGDSTAWWLRYDVYEGTPDSLLRKGPNLWRPLPCMA